MPAHNAIFDIPAFLSQRGFPVQATGFQQHDRACVLRIAHRIDAVQPKFMKAVVNQGFCELGRIMVSPILLKQQAANHPRIGFLVNQDMCTADFLSAFFQNNRHLIAEPRFRMPVAHDMLQMRFCLFPVHGFCHLGN